MKAIIKEDKKLILEEQNLMLQTENNIEKIDFEFPSMINEHKIEKFRKYIEIEAEDKSVVDEIFNDTYYLKRTITKYSSINIQIVLIYEEKDIVFKTTKKILMFDESINADENLKQEEQSLLYKMSEKVNQLENNNTDIKNDIENLQTNKVDKIEGKDLSTNDFSNEYKDKLDSLENYDDTKVKQDISNIQQEQTIQNTKISNLEEDNITNKQDILNLQENISDIQQDNINHNTRIEEIKQEQSTQNETIEKLNKKIDDLENLVPTRKRKRRKHNFE